MKIKKPLETAKDLLKKTHGKVISKANKKQKEKNLWKRDALRKVDRVIHTPSATASLLDSDATPGSKPSDIRKIKKKRAKQLLASKVELSKNPNFSLETRGDAAQLKTAITNDGVMKNVENTLHRIKRTFSEEELGNKGKKLKSSIKKLHKTVSDSNVLKECSQKYRESTSSLTGVPTDAGKMKEETSSKSVGSLLRAGIKFSSEESFRRFANLHKKNKRSKKSKPNCEDNLEEVHDNPAFSDSLNASLDVSQSEDSFNKSSACDNSTVSDSHDSPRKKAQNVKREQLKKLLEKTNRDADVNKSRTVGVRIEAKSPSVSRSPGSVNGTKKAGKSVVELAKDRLSASRFRYLNEQLYSQPSAASVAMFKKDPSLFNVYHKGYQLQANTWPLDPLDEIIAACLHLPSEAIIADMGCGEARLSRSLPNTVHSFDLISLAPGVVECDMSHVPLPNASVDVVVFCLSLMGTNVKDFLAEASRILRPDGFLKIAELESRFNCDEGSVAGAESFIKDVEKYGFTVQRKDLDKEYFYFMYFKKTGEKKSRKKLPAVTLKPCLYKKR